MMTLEIEAASRARVDVVFSVNKCLGLSIQISKKLSIQIQATVDFFLKTQRRLPRNIRTQKHPKKLSASAAAISLFD